MLKLNKKYINLFLLLVFLFSPTLAGAKTALEIEYQPIAFTAEVELIQAENNEPFLMPEGFEALSPSYEYAFKTSGFYDPSRPLLAKVYYNQSSNLEKQLFSFDFISSVWRPVEAVDHPELGYMSYQTDATSAWLRVLTQSGPMSTGKASWYKYKEGLFAASPDYPKGTQLRVYNLDNDKYVDVVVNDYGPDRSVHPDRVIDLDRVAFEKLAPLSQGLARVRVEEIKTIATPEIDIPKEVVDLGLSAKAALVMREDTGEVLWEKNQDLALPIASLTKLVAMKVFLDTNPNLKQVVSYKDQDLQYNYLYCPPTDPVARLRVEEGETMTIEDLLYSTLVGSANNTVETLVRVSGLSRDGFIAQMNQFARNLGANNTSFIEPSGLAPENVSSVSDYAIITKEIFKDPLIEKISTTQNYSFKTINTGKEHNLVNTNREMLANSAYKIIGSKTGFLYESLYCLVTRVETEFGNLLIINLASPTLKDRGEDNIKLLEFALGRLN